MQLLILVPDRKGPTYPLAALISVWANLVSHLIAVHLHAEEEVGVIYAALLPASTPRQGGLELLQPGFLEMVVTILSGEGVPEGGTASRAAAKSTALVAR